jgi:AcrR family transcriptional regulator
MAEAASAVGAPRVSRLDRRKARTRQALIDAAVRLIAEGRGDRASIAEITEEADIGFGSFCNHFDTKEQLFATASEEVLERWGQLIDRASAGLTDPAELFAVGTRITGRLVLGQHQRRQPGIWHLPSTPHDGSPVTTVRAI